MRDIVTGVSACHENSLKNGGRFKSMNYSFLVEFGLLFDNETIDGQLFDIYVLEKSHQHN